MHDKNEVEIEGQGQPMLQTSIFVHQPEQAFPPDWKPRER